MVTATDDKYKIQVILMHGSTGPWHDQMIAAVMCKLYSEAISDHPSHKAVVSDSFRGSSLIGFGICRGIE